MSTKQKLLKLSIITLSAFVVTSCQLYNPVTETQLYPVQMQLKQTQNTNIIKTSAKPNKEELKQIASHWKKTSDDKMMLNFIYNKNMRGASAKAIKFASIYKRILQDFGVNNIDIKMLAKNNYKESNPQLKITYNAWKTAAPVGCEGMYMPGAYGGEVPEYSLKYKMGCNTETVIGKMVVRPKDLAGTEGLPKGDSRREGTIVENYKSGTVNERMEGISVNDTGGSGG